MCVRDKNTYAAKAARMGAGVPCLVTKLVWLPGSSSTVTSVSYRIPSVAKPSVAKPPPLPWARGGQGSAGPLLQQSRTRMMSSRLCQAQAASWSGSRPRLVVRGVCGDDRPGAGCRARSNCIYCCHGAYAACFRRCGVLESSAFLKPGPRSHEAGTAGQLSSFFVFTVEISLYAR